MVVMLSCCTGTLLCEIGMMVWRANHHRRGITRYAQRHYAEQLGWKFVG